MTLESDKYWSTRCFALFFSSDVTPDTNYEVIDEEFHPFFLEGLHPKGKVFSCSQNGLRKDASKCKMPFL